MEREIRQLLKPPSLPREVTLGASGALGLGAPGASVAGPEGGVVAMIGGAALGVLAARLERRRLQRQTQHQGK